MFICFRWNDEQMSEEKKIVIENGEKKRATAAITNIVSCQNRLWHTSVWQKYVNRKIEKSTSSPLIPSESTILLPLARSTRLVSVQTVERKNSVVVVVVLYVFLSAPANNAQIHWHKAYFRFHKTAANMISSFFSPFLRFQAASLISFTFYRVCFFVCVCVCSAAADFDNIWRCLSYGFYSRAP